MNSRNIVITFLILVVIGLVGGAIYLGGQLSNLPDDGGGDVSTSTFGTIDECIAYGIKTSFGCNGSNCTVGDFCFVADSDGDGDVNDEPISSIVNCSEPQKAYIYKCPTGSTGACFDNESPIAGGVVNPGQTFNINDYISGCGHYQIDISDIDSPNSSGNCGATYYDYEIDCDVTPTPTDGTPPTTTPTPAPDDKGLTIKGRVICQDPGGPEYPVEYARVRLHYTTGTGDNYINLRTDAMGRYTWTGYFGQANAQRFNVYVDKIPATGVLSNGTPFTQMVASSNGGETFAINCNKANTNTYSIGCIDGTNDNYCGTYGDLNLDAYRTCRLPTGPQSSVPFYDGFRFVFRNCSQATVTTPVVTTPVVVTTPPVVNPVCQNLVSNVNTVSNVAGNIIYFSVRYSSTTKPFNEANARFSVRNASNTEIASLTNVNYRLRTDGLHAYNTSWEPNGAAAGTYSVVFYPDGVNQETVAACSTTFTVTDTPPAEADFEVQKSGAEICLANGDSQITYTITVTNTTSVEGVITSVVDTLDPDFVGLGITPTNITPSFGTYSNGVITWIGTLADRTFAAGQSKTYSFQVVVPASNYDVLGGNVVNTVLVTDEGGGTDEDSVLVPMECSAPTTPSGLPDTAILDNEIGRVVFGIALIIVGFVVIRFGIVVDILKAFGIELNWGLSSKQVFEGNIRE